jgi:hypothetical protein
MAEAPGKPFSPSGHRLARVLWIHYLSKAGLFTLMWKSCILAYLLIIFHPCFK